MPAVLAILVAVIFATVGQVLVKKGLNSLGPIDFGVGLLIAYFQILRSPFVCLGALTYTCSVFFWLYALSKVDLSFAFPFLALSYVLIMIASAVLLGEHISALRWLGVLAICGGLMLVSRS